MTMTTAQFKARLADLLEIKTKEADNILWAFSEALGEVVEKADKVTIPNVGTLQCKVSEARVGRNPATGESVKVPAKIRVSFRVTKALKDRAPSIAKGRKMLEERESQKRGRGRGRPKGTTRKSSDKRVKAGVRRF